MPLKFFRRIGSSADEKPVKNQSDTIIITYNLTASRLHDVFLGKTSYRLGNIGLGLKTRRVEYGDNLFAPLHASISKWVSDILQKRYIPYIINI